MISDQTNETYLADKKVCVLDVYGILYQVFHTMREMSGPKGQPTGAAFGLIRDVMNVLTKIRPDYIFCAFDVPEKTFRHDLYPAYKANRPEMPDDLRPQTVFVRQLLDALCVARLEKAGYEADDILATVARQAENRGAQVVLVTSDKDARQLITEKTSLYNIRTESLFTAVELRQTWGIRPDQVVDYQTLVGDSTDNVPGIPLIGPKSATALLQQYETLDNIFDHTAELKGKKKENIENGRAQAELTRRLVRLDSDMPLVIDWEKGRFQGIDRDRLLALFRDLGFRSLVPKISELAETFGTRHAENRTPDGPTEKFGGDLNPNAPPMNDGTKSEKTSQTVAQASLNPMSETAAENHAIAEKLFATISRPASKFPHTDAFETPFDPSAIVYHTVDTPEKFDKFFARLQNAKIFSVDLETIDSEGSNKVRPRFALIVGLAFCFDSLNAYYLPIRAPLVSETLNEKIVLERLRPIFESTEYQKIGQNIKFDRIVLRSAGVELRGTLFDTMVADYLLHAGEQRHNLDELAERYLAYETVKISELIGTGRNQKKMSDIPTDIVTRYAGEDALIPWRLYPILLEKLQQQPDLLRLLEKLEIPLIDTLVEMEFNGIAVDRGHFEKLAERFSQKLARLERQIRDLTADADPDPTFAESFNINSPQQLQRILFDDLKLPVVKKTKTGRSTDYETLEELADSHPLPAKLIEHRTAAKLKGTYIDPIPELIHPITGRIHASFNQVVTATGRLSSSDPNLQNIPVRSEEGKLIRQGFVPDRRQGFDTLLSADYSQIELRVLTHFSKDENLTRAFESGLDIHAAVAAKLFGVAIEQVDSAMRRVAKTVNFGLVYGQSAFGLAKTLGIPQNEAADYIRTFFETYPGIHEFLDRVLEECRATGCVETILGRQRQIEGVRGARGNQQLNMPERTAINTVVQGSAADLMKLAMINVSRRLSELNGGSADAPKQRSLFDDETEKARLLLQIHDELIFETTNDFAPDLARIVQQEMELGQPLSVPLVVDIARGATWGEE